MLSHTGNLSKALQHTRLNAAERQHLVRMPTTIYLKYSRTEEMYRLFWQKIIMQAKELDIAEPILPSKRKAPRWYIVRVGTGVTPYSTEDHFRANYYKALDTVIGCISDRFKQEGSCAIMDLKYVLCNA